MHESSCIRALTGKTSFHENITDKSRKVKPSANVTIHNEHLYCLHYPFYMSASYTVCANHVKTP